MTLAGTASCPAFCRAVIALTGTDPGHTSSGPGLSARGDGRPRLAATLGIDPIGAWAAGALYAFNTYQVNEAPRADLLFHGFTALALGELVRFLKTGETRRAWYVAGLMVLQGLASTYLLLYGALVLTLVAIAAFLARPRRIGPRLLRLLLPALAARRSSSCCRAAAPALVAHVGFARDCHPHRPEAYVSTLHEPRVRRDRGPRPSQQKGPTSLARSLALALLAVSRIAGWLTRRRHRPRTHLGAAGGGAAVLLVALSLGSEAVAWGKTSGPPLRLLHLAVPGFQYIRIPERLGLPAMLFVALLVGQAVTFLRARGPRAGTAAVALALFVPLEHLSPLPLTERIPVWGDVPAVYRWLARDGARAVAEVPIHGEGLIRKETLEEYFSTYHFKPIIHGYVSYPPLLSVLLRRAAADFPSESSVQTLQRVGVDTVVVHHGRAGSAGLEAAVAEAIANGRLVSVARFSGPSAHVYQGTADEVVRLIHLPREEAAPLPGGRRAARGVVAYSATAGDPQSPATATCPPPGPFRRAARRRGPGGGLRPQPEAGRGRVPLRRDARSPLSSASRG